MKIRDHMITILGALAFIMVTGVAKAEDSTTPQEFVTAIAELPAKIGTHISDEVEKTKAYQAKSWADAKTQWQSLINKFVKTGETQ